MLIQTDTVASKNSVGIIGKGNNLMQIPGNLDKFSYVDLIILDLKPIAPKSNSLLILNCI